MCAPYRWWTKYGRGGWGAGRQFKQHGCFFLDFWIQEGDLLMQTRVFNITIGQVSLYPMDIAATVVLNRSPSKKNFPSLFVHLTVPFLYGCIYLQSPLSLLLSGLKLPLLLTLSNQYTKKLAIDRIGIHRRNQRSSTNCWQKLLSPNQSNKISCQH